MTDRRVHGRTDNGAEIVRYDRAGKWWVEHRSGVRETVSFEEAASLAVHGEWYPGLPGGRRFDALVRNWTDRRAPR